MNYIYKFNLINSNNCAKFQFMSIFVVIIQNKDTKKPLSAAKLRIKAQFF